MPGFDTGSPATVDAIAPNGERLSLDAPTPLDHPPEILFTTFDIPLFAQTGSYEIVAQQGELVASGSLVVGQPGLPILKVRPPTNGAPGDQFVIDIAGLESGDAPFIDVYTPDESGTRFHYLTSLEATASDELGRVAVEVRTAPTDPPGVYCMVIRPSESPGCGPGRIIKLG